jgi:uncharacterized protein (DUF885 family)
MRRLPLLLLSLALAACGRAPAPGAPSGTTAAADQELESLSPEARRLRDITEQYYEHWLELNPLSATAQGDHRYDARLGDYVSPTWMADWLAYEQEALQQLREVDAAKLSGEDLITWDAFRYGRRMAVESFRYPSELLPANQFSGMHLEFAVLGSGDGAQPFRTAQDYDNFLARMDGFVEWVDQAINNMRTGAAKGAVLPRVVVERMIPQLAAIAVEDAGACECCGPAAAHERVCRQALRAGAARVPAPARLPEERVPRAGAADGRVVGAAERRRVVRVSGALPHHDLADAR